MTNFEVHRFRHAEFFVFSVGREPDPPILKFLGSAGALPSRTTCHSLFATRHSPVANRHSLSFRQESCSPTFRPLKLALRFSVINYGLKPVA